ncbi:alpha/beta fold hydrolase [Actinoplanes sp. NPDC049265]|uniref:alpha/beta fold hydrolase n=1 Tax=Actinoplanes sp. NPDC049265 TaxID=3363902 RepID=UPI00371379CD
MPSVRVNGIDLWYETTGHTDDPALLLVMGLGEQLIAWPDGFCAALAARGFHVIRFDNRDVGRSAWLDDLGVPDMLGLFGGDLSSVRYRLADLVADTAGLIEALHLRRPHVAGVSMGGMIAQQLAIDRPDLVASLASLSSTTGDPAVGQSTLDDPSALMPPADADRAAAIAADLALWHVIGSPAYPVGDEELTRLAAAKFDRGHHPVGTVRQLAAILATPDRTAALGRLDLPAVVIHGDADRLIDVSGGRATAAAIPGAELVILPGMGHDLPEAVWPRVVDAIAANAGRARALSR